MARRRRRKRQSGFDVLASLPWPVGFVAGVITFFIIRDGIGWAGLASDNAYLVSISAPFRDGALAPLAWLALGICWLASAVSLFKRKRAPRLRKPKSARRAPTVEPLPANSGVTVSPALANWRFLDEATRTDASPSSNTIGRPAPITAENITNLSWLQFERLIADSYRRKGFDAELTPEGADEGVDIVLRERDNVLLVQCKHWNSYRVGVSVARELFGVMHAKAARKAVLATSGRLTAEAERFCRHNAIYWLDADRLPGFIDPRAMPPQAEISADRASRCPLCGDAMVARTGRKTGRPFWGCVRYPACRGKRFAEAKHG